MRRLVGIAALTALLIVPAIALARTHHAALTTASGPQLGGDRICSKAGCGAVECTSGYIVEPAGGGWWELLTAGSCLAHTAAWEGKTGSFCEMQRLEGWRVDPGADVGVLQFGGPHEVGCASEDRVETWGNPWPEHNPLPVSNGWEPFAGPACLVTGCFSLDYERWGPTGDFIEPRINGCCGSVQPAKPYVGEEACAYGNGSSHACGLVTAVDQTREVEGVRLEHTFLLAAESGAGWTGGSVDHRRSGIVEVEGVPRVLPAYSAEALGIIVKTGAETVGYEIAPALSAMRARLP